MIALLLLPVAALAADPPAPPRLGPIGRQQLPARGCAAYLWQIGGGGGAPTLVAMASADPAVLRLSIDGAPPADLPRVAQRGEGLLGLPAHADFRLAGVTASLTMTPVARADLRDGASIPQATLQIRHDGGDELVVPLAGLVGCRPLP